MDFLLDTNHWSFLQRGHPSVVQHVSSLPPNSRLFMPVIAQAELLLGVELAVEGSRQVALRRLYETTVTGAAEIVPVDRSAAEHFARIAACLRKLGRPIATNDLWIAAIASSRQMMLVSGDAAFRAIPNMKIEDWSR